ncbi:MAG: hydrogenase expression/formation protein HypE [Planctomycetaceae bacterium]|nr:hydrogenase expression/formation protein HypE [Planctomycetaceae bacterium]
MNNGLDCPLPQSSPSDVVSLAHGEGSGLTRRLIQDRIKKVLTNPVLDQLGDAALLGECSRQVMMTTDSFVVSPLKFPGGDIGSMAVYGTVNDLLVSGAVPHCLSLSLIIEEGLPLSVLDEVLENIQRACEECGVFIATGDTKVVARGECDLLFINTTGIGFARDVLPLGPASIEQGDELIVTGPIGQHGIAVLACRNGLNFTPPPLSDSKPLVAELAALEPLMPRVRCMRDATRGGVGAVLQEWAESSGCTLTFRVQDVPVSLEVRAVSELLGLDPMHVACEGTMVLAVNSSTAKDVVTALHNAGFPCASRIGTARERDIVPVTCVGLLGQEQPFQEPLGAPLPRIC